MGVVVVRAPGDGGAIVELDAGRCQVFSEGQRAIWVTVDRPQITKPGLLRRGTHFAAAETQSNTETWKVSMTALQR